MEEECLERQLSELELLKVRVHPPDPWQFACMGTRSRMGTRSHSMNFPSTIHKAVPMSVTSACAPPSRSLSQRVSIPAQGRILWLRDPSPVACLQSCLFAHSFAPGLRLWFDTFDLSVSSGRIPRRGGCRIGERRPSWFLVPTWWNG